MPIRRADNEVWLSLTEAVMRDPSGETAGRIFAFRDISAERVVEQMRSDFVSTVSHELRAPLTSIYGFAATLLREDVEFEEEERRTFLAYIESEAQRLTTIVDKLLSVARLDAGDLQLEIAPVDVRSVISDAVEGARAEAGAGHQFVVDLPEAPLAARTDPDKLRQVLANLVDNAVRFSPERRNGDGRRVAARRDDRAQCGRPGCRDPATWSRTGSSRSSTEWVTRRPEARVWGSSSRKVWSARSGGRITVRSGEGRGSSFVVELPARDEEAEE